MTSILEVFVNPNICAQLKIAGVSQNTLAKYRQYHNDQVIIVSECFDELGLYKEISGLVDYKSSYEEFSAYTIQEIAKVIPGFALSTDGFVWTACGSVTFRIPCVDCKRMTDAAGALLLRSILDRCLSVEEINKAFDRESFISK